MPKKLKRSLFKIGSGVSGGEIIELDNKKYTAGPFRIKQEVDKFTQILFEYVMRDNNADPR